LEAFLSEIPAHKVKEVCIDMKEAFWKAANRLFPEANVGGRPFPHMIADANKRMDEARRIEQDVRHMGKVKIPKKIFLVEREHLRDRGRQRVDELLALIIMNKKASDDVRFYRWGNILNGGDNLY